MMEDKKKREERKKYYMISTVAKLYNIHPQTLRLYEREGLLKPSRTEGNTRLYSEEDLRQLEIILNLTRELGVNLAGVEIILNMRKKMEEMQKEVNELLNYIKREFFEGREREFEFLRKSLVKTTPAKVIKIEKIEEKNNA
ncbi:helix-turn-helix transcriptional regulator [Candidatus Aminicenantes bacterium AC-335-B20]|jgi:MerR family transcriptional regulator/heat shock protein HspR|nr:helix-turn-helix transcriptional regulator [SCandidatus Aminicenantes bacterium Aminicenantia_JdfR_composite]MCP2596340.1 helix-turn-helix transcriptional regulator [Candidatus Aminicenantes bacterium AC-335-G13]MCP2599008.1 helix-turn-helix transcriptional regulator [Candidatus Aminicenantes bacterium AC-335-B20]MCP2605419.1 helix-turn-helix transcriptional regulator [Candidatus Aminicenantes bacterium AC-335-O07]MCP2617815.1 helix-turn-helix transcriptional regulator [Candidatus Aminicenan